MEPLSSGDIKLSLTYSHREFLKYLGEHGGETSIDWHNVKPPAATHIRKLADMGLVSESPLIGTGRFLVRLTDMGRNVLAMIQQSEMIL